MIGIVYTIEDKPFIFEYLYGNWYEPCDVFSPFTNNAIEIFNLLIKEKYTNWKRLHFSDFWTTCFEIRIDFSNKSASLDKIVYNKIEINLDISLKFKLIKRYVVEEIVICYKKDDNLNLKKFCSLRNFIKFEKN